MNTTKITLKTVSGLILFQSTKETIKEAILEKYTVDADLRDADLRGANLRDADLRGANLRDADLRDADLCGADLYGTNLRGADLRGADLYGTDLYGTDLRGVDLHKLPIDFINQCSRDILFIFHCLKREVPYLKKSIIEGTIDGSTYEGDCACLVGTLAHGKDVNKTCQSIPFYEKGTHNMGETFFLNIKKGDTPENNEFSKHVLALIEMHEKGIYHTIAYTKPVPETPAEKMTLEQVNKLLGKKVKIIE